MRLRILLADDHQIVRDVLKGLLTASGDMVVVAEVADGASAVRLAAEMAPDVVLIDADLPHVSGVDAARQIHARNPQTQVVMLSRQFARRIVLEAFNAGARGHLLKDVSAEELVAAVRAVAAGKTYISPRVADAFVKSYILADPPTANLHAVTEVLTPRERQVLQLMAEGRATKQIAMDLQVSVKTVETHRRQIMEKLQLYSIAELTKYAIRQGLTSLG